jgi:3-deoxy-7-phosphoheptulonate synthase
MKARKEIQNIVSKKDDRLFVIVGPCSIHDTVAANEYGLYFSFYRKSFLFIY